MIESKLISFHRILPSGELFVLNQKANNINICEVKQVHSNKIVKFDQKDLKDIEADGIQFNYSDLKGTHIAIKTADCMPIIILGKDSGVLIHAGWKGLSLGILQQELIREIKPFYAFIGPSIQQSSFEVSDEFRDNFPNSSNFHEDNERLFFDLQREAMDQLYNYYDGIKVETSGENTYSLKKYHSYRLNKTTNRNWNLFTL